MQPGVLRAQTLRTQLLVVKPGGLWVQALRAQLLEVRPVALGAQTLRAQLLDVKPEVLFEGSGWMCSRVWAGLGRLVRRRLM